MVRKVMGKKRKWFTAVKKTFGSESKEKKDQRRYNEKKWFGKQKQEDLFTLQVENEPTPPPPSPPQKEIKVATTTHKLALASATLAEAAVAAAQAAVEVVRLTSAVAFRESGKLNKDAAATKTSHFSESSSTDFHSGYRLNCENNTAANTEELW
ncbi:hypothetical protein MKX03_011225 [Papaver bracteatum]|nr:hypothetical protein MKX03_011225 [Papaver bracteatum]